MSNLPAVGNIVEPLLSFEEAWQQWQRAIGMAQDRYKRPSKRTSQSGRTKVLVVPDVHAPFHEPAMFAAMLKREADADKVICIGDISDAYALSRFLKYETMSFRDEWAQVTLCVQELANRFSDVEIIIGNHDSRLEKQLLTHLTSDMVDAIRYMTGGILCPLKALAKRYPNVRIAGHQVPGTDHTVDWFTTIGDAWLGHPEKYSILPGAALRKVEEYLADNEQQLGLSRYKLIVLGHTHQLGMFPWRSGQLLVECGTLAKTQGYMLSPRISGRPQRRGYVTFEQENGVTDLNSVRMFWFDVDVQAA